MSDPEATGPVAMRPTMEAAASSVEDRTSTRIGSDAFAVAEARAALDPDQRAVVDSRARQLLVLAGAGTGKTRALVHRVARLIDDGVSPADILLLTFTRKAAATMRERLRALAMGSATEWAAPAGRGDAPTVEIGTFHAAAWRRVRANQSRLGWAPEHPPIAGATSLTVAEEPPSTTAWPDEAPRAGASRLQLLAPEAAAFALDDLLESPELRDDTEARDAVRALGKRGEGMRALAVRLLPDRAWSIVRPPQFAGDGTGAAASMADARRPSPRRSNPTLSLFGDTSPTAVQDDPLQRVRIAWTRAQRSLGRVVLDDLVAWWWHAIDQDVTPCPSHLLVDEIQDLDPLQWAVVASLAARADSVTLVGDLAQSIYGFRGAAPPRLDDLRRALPELELVSLRHNHRSYGPLVALGNAARTDGVRCVPTREGHTTPVVVQLRDALQQAEFVAQRCEELLAEGRTESDFAVLARTRAELADVAREFASRGLPCRIREEDELDLASPRHAGDDPTADGIELTTVHRAKGLEWPVVFVIGLVEGRFPLWGTDQEPNAREEEARLFHVAVTRARDELYLTHPAVDATSGLRALTPSRFLRRLERPDATDASLLQRWDVEEAPRE